jgi:hypothetical protein
MELRGDDVVPSHESAEVSSMGARTNLMAARRIVVSERMIEIEVGAVARPELAERLGEAHLVPAYMRDANTRLRIFAKLPDLSADPAQAFMPALLFAEVRHELHPHADAEQGPAVLKRPLLERGKHAAGAKPVHTKSKGPNARQQHMSAARELVSPAHQHSATADRVQRVQNRSDIA